MWQQCRSACGDIAGTATIAALPITIDMCVVYAHAQTVKRWQRLQDFNKEVLTSLTGQNVTANRQRLPKSRRPVSARFFGGDWSTLGSLLAKQNLGGSYDMILSAETIYSPESQQQLFDCIKQVCLADKDFVGHCHSDKWECCMLQNLTFQAHLKYKID